MAFLGLASLMGYSILYFFLKPHTPLVKADIPQQTIDFFKKLPGYIDLGVIFNPNPDPSDWDKYESIKDMKTLEDSCFIVYYSSLDSVAEKIRAETALSLSNEAIPKAQSFMKNYPFPYQVKNRKLPIYLANSKTSYRNIQRQLGVAPVEWSVGIYIWEYSTMGTLARGIVISDAAETAFNASRNECLKIVLWHEINHYVYFTNFNYMTNSPPYLWFTEGCAEYFAGNTSRAAQISKTQADKYSLSSPKNDGSEYWVGYTAFLYYDKAYSKNKLSDLVYLSYKNNISTSLSNSSGVTLGVWEQGWREYIKE